MRILAHKHELAMTDTVAMKVKNNYTFFITDADTRQTTQQPHGV